MKEDTELCLCIQATFYCTFRYLCITRQGNNYLKKQTFKKYNQTFRSDSSIRKTSIKQKRSSTIDKMKRAREGKMNLDEKSFAKVQKFTT